MTAQQISVSTIVPVEPKRAWQLYTNPDDIVQWNFANDEWHCPSANVDLKVGGTHTARMEAKDGSFGFDFHGTYTEVNEPKALTLELEDGRKSRTTFSASGSGTVIQTIFDAEAENSAEMQRAGWQAILDNFRKHAER